MEYATLLLSLNGKADHQVPKYGVTPAEAAVLRVLHGDDAVTDIDVIGELGDTDDENLQPRTDRQEIERLRAMYSRQEGEVITSPAVTALFGSGLGAKLPKTFADLDLHDEQFAVKERKTKKADPLDHDGDGKKGGVKNDADGYAGKTVNELRAHAEKEGVDLTGISKKDDIIAALELNDENKKAAGTTSVFE